MQEINNEIEFENNIRQIILEEVLPSNSDLILLKSKKAVDIVICRNNSNPALFFLEIKYHKNNHGRLGFGHGKGGGFQPEILKKRPHIFETNLKWIIGSEESEHYYLLDNTTLVNYLQGGQVADKFNGIQKRLFIKETGINKQELINQLKNWLLNSN